MRTRFFFHTIGEAFPPENAMAQVMWSLVAIRGDIGFEWAGIGRQPEYLDERESWFRSAYFFRGSLRSLYSGRIQLDRLTQVSSEFKELADATAQWNTFVDLRRSVRKSSAEFNELRNAFGAHTEESVAAALTSAERECIVPMSIDERGELGVGWASAAYLTAVAHHSEGNDASAMLVRMRDATLNFVKCFNVAFGVYCSRYPALRRP